MSNHPCRERQRGPRRPTYVELHHSAQWIVGIDLTGVTAATARVGAEFDAWVRRWRWKDVDTYPGEVALATPAGLATTVRVPTDAAAGQSIQRVLEATDDGMPPLTRYARVVVFVTH